MPATPDDAASQLPPGGKGDRITARRPERLTKDRDRTLGTEVSRQLGQIARSVAYLELTFSGGQRAYGTGFLIAPDYLLTNYHNVVHEDYGAVKAITADFDREEGFTGTPLVVKGIVPPVAVDAGHDWAVIRLERPVTDRVPIALSTKWAISKDDQIIIVQHPLGGFKKFALDALSLQYLDADVIQYLADTQKGSSGSPVFNTRLHCIGLHHAEAEVESGDGTETAWRNEGIRIERVMEGLRAAGIPFNDDAEGFISMLKEQLPQRDIEQRALEMAYLRRVQAIANPLPLAVIDPRSVERNRQQTMDLLRVYVALNTDTPGPVIEELRHSFGNVIGGPPTRPLSALEAVAQEHHTVLLGDPGSGKSTFLNYLALCLAGARLEQAAEAGNLPGDRWLEQLGPAWTHGALLPVHVILRRFARTAWCDGTAEGLWNYVRETLAGDALADFAPHLRRRLLAGGVLMLLDGLDEVADVDQRETVRDAVMAFAATFNHRANRYLVTCRVYAYQDPCCQLDRYVEHRLAPLTEEQSDAFIESWYQEVRRLGWKDEDEAAALAGKLKEATRRPDLAVLAGNPLQLTMMASLHYSWGRLPDDRVDLYREMVVLLLVRWQENRLGEETGISRVLSYSELESALERVAFEAHQAQGGGEGAADISEGLLLSVLKDYLAGSWDRAKRLVTYIRERAGLLIERGTGVYTFPHRSYQEYLAGSYLAVQEDFPEQTLELLQQNYGQWREVALWAASVVTRDKRPYLAVDVAATLCPDALPEGPVSDEDWRLAVLSGEALLEAGLDYIARQPRHQTVLKRVRQWLAGLVTRGALAPLERARAGQTLARLGDPREGVGVRDGLPDIRWSAPIPAGPFPMGNSQKTDPEADDDEAPRHDEEIREPYCISIYPITNAQYALFVQDGGYTAGRRHCWTAAGWEWKGERTGPYKAGGVFDLPNHPVVGVTWYEAAAFCNWLSEKRPDWRVELPTEAQWERAARSTDGRKYPWNGDITPDHANCGMNVGTTTAVGVYPLGAAECGALDMSGNVREWCRTQWRGDFKSYPDDNSDGISARVVRGGCWPDDRWFARCAYRLGLVPDGFGNLLGFRVALSLSS